MEARSERSYEVKKGHEVQNFNHMYQPIMSTVEVFTATSTVPKCLVLS